MICDFVKSKGAISKQSVVNSLQQKINEISITNENNHIADNVLIKNNFNSSKIDEILGLDVVDGGGGGDGGGGDGGDGGGGGGGGGVDVNEASVIKIQNDLPVICQSSNDLQFPMTTNLIENICDGNQQETTIPGIEVNMRKDSQVSSGSKIPVFNPSLRISKCSSWACGDISPSPEITDLTPGNLL